MPHKPVLLEQVLEQLNLQPGAVVLDGTLGSAGHGLEVAKAIGESGKYIGLDQDPESIERSREILGQYPQVSLHHSNFEKFDEVLHQLNIEALDAVILDIGVSSNQLETAERGFSFDRDGPLDMRMDPSQEVTAAQLVNALSQHELSEIFWKYGQEKKSRQFAEAIVKKRPFKTTKELTKAIEMALPAKLRNIYRKEKGSRPPWAKRHIATRVFQALRIAVNDELGVLERALPKMWRYLKHGGKFAVITFHSLEDRIVKQFFRTLKHEKAAQWLTKKPIEASRSEISKNPRARSARLRVVERLDFEVT